MDKIFEDCLQSTNPKLIQKACYAFLKILLKTENSQTELKEFISFASSMEHRVTIFSFLQNSFLEIMQKVKNETEFQVLLDCETSFYDYDFVNSHFFIEFSALYGQLDLPYKEMLETHQLENISVYVPYFRKKNINLDVLSGNGNISPIFTKALMMTSYQVFYENHYRRILHYGAERSSFPQHLSADELLPLMLFQVTSFDVKGQSNILNLLENFDHFEDLQKRHFETVYSIICLTFERFLTSANHTEDMIKLENLPHHQVFLEAYFMSLCQLPNLSLELLLDQCLKILQVSKGNFDVDLLQIMLRNKVSSPLAESVVLKFLNIIGALCQSEYFDYAKVFWNILDLGHAQLPLSISIYKSLHILNTLPDGSYFVTEIKSARNDEFMNIQKECIIQNTLNELLKPSRISAATRKNVELYHEEIFARLDGLSLVDASDIRYQMSLLGFDVLLSNEEHLFNALEQF